MHQPGLCTTATTNSCNNQPGEPVIAIVVLLTKSSSLLFVALALFYKCIHKTTDYSGEREIIQEKQNKTKQTKHLGTIRQKDKKKTKKIRRINTQSIFSNALRVGMQHRFSPFIYAIRNKT